MQDTIDLVDLSAPERPARGQHTAITALIERLAGACSCSEVQRRGACCRDGVGKQPDVRVEVDNLAENR